MTAPVLYAHPFSSYCQKVLMAFYEKDVACDLRMLSPENPDAIAERHALWPLDRFPVLRAGDRTIAESSIIIEWLDHHHPTAKPLIPAAFDTALTVRTLDRVFDNYVMTPMQSIVFDRIRPTELRDPHGVGMAKATLEKSYHWLNTWLSDREWAAGNAFSLADCAAAPALFYADWVHPFRDFAAVTAYFRRLLARPSFARCVAGGRPYRHMFPGGAPPE